jgi:3-dehydroquinate synthase
LIQVKLQVVNGSEIYKNEMLKYPVLLGDHAWIVIEKFLQELPGYESIFILTDHHTRDLCLPVLFRKAPFLRERPVYSIPPGESSKELRIVEGLLMWLINSGAMKNSLLVNLGGGVVSDIGGFAAATLKRGISYVNIPTSLIGQADAAIGGKTGVNISGIKNQVGVFYDPLAVFILPEFLVTLPERHVMSGNAEIIKSAVLAGGTNWEILKKANLRERSTLPGLIKNTVDFKCSVVARDPLENHERKMLNFGHTIGHALESFSNENGKEGLLHGEAVAAGMICEAFISTETCGLPANVTDEITRIILDNSRLEKLDAGFIDYFHVLMDHDKKMTPAGVGFSLIENPGMPCLEKIVSRKTIRDSFLFYNKTM